MREACAQGNQILPKIAGYMDTTIYFGGLKISANSCIIILINIKSFIFTDHFLYSHDVYV